MAGGVLVVLVVLLGVLFPIGLYYLVRAEHDQREEMDRETAERVARQDKDER